jgi:hypothetical protein
VLLDLVGWDAAVEPRDVDVDLREDGAALREALGRYVPLLQDQEKEADINDKWRAAEGKPPRRGEIISRLVALRVFAALVDERLG